MFVIHPCAQSFSSCSLTYLSFLLQNKVVDVDNLKVKLQVKTLKKKKKNMFVDDGQISHMN